MGDKAAKYYLWCTIYFSLFYRLVTSDVAFYSGTYKTLRGLEHLTNHMSDLWNGLW